jgi:ribosome-associated protein
MGKIISCIPCQELALTSQIVDSKVLDSRSYAFLAANACQSKMGKGTVVLDVHAVTFMADYFVVTGAESAAQVRAIVEACEEALESTGLKAKSIEGKREGRWVLLDFGIVIVHVLQEKERDYYKIEQFWNTGLIVDRQEWVEKE